MRLIKLNFIALEVACIVGATYLLVRSICSDLQMPIQHSVLTYMLLMCAIIFQSIQDSIDWDEKA